MLVIPAARLSLLGDFTGFRPFHQPDLDALLNPKFMEFRPRSTVEEDPSFKQLIPYAILCAEVDGVKKVFQYTRGKGQGEKRLHAKLSIGIGGHISREDADSSDLYRSGMLRELTEETIIEAAYDEELVGFIYDDTSAVGRVHLGVVHMLKLSSPAARAREVDLVDSGFEAIDVIKSNIDRFEVWSQLCIKNLF